jgi:hypothetical protein
MSCLREYETEMHLSLFRSNLFLEHQSDSKSTFDCSSIQSCMLCILEYNFKSSEYKRESTVKISLMSFINNKKSNGPRFDPCGMPELTVKRNELNPIYSTYRTLSDIYDLSRDKREEYQVNNEDLQRLYAALLSCNYKKDLDVGTVAAVENSDTLTTPNF